MLSSDLKKMLKCSTNELKICAKKMSADERLVNDKVKTIQVNDHEIKESENKNEGLHRQANANGMKNRTMNDCTARR